MEHHASRSEIIKQGLGLSDGIAIGHLYLFPRPAKRSVRQHVIEEHEICHEVWRYERARRASRSDLERLQIFLAKDSSDPAALSIIDTHIQLLSDPMMTEMVEKAIRDLRLSCESAFHHVIEAIEHKIGSFSSSVDVQDISHRILRYLVTDHVLEGLVHTMPQSAIAAGYEFVPTCVAESEPKIKAFVSEIGADTSHMALIARARHIPYVSGICFQELESESSAHAILDGCQGTLVLYPTPDRIADYMEKQRLLKERKERSIFIFNQSNEHLKPQMKLLANVESVEDLKELKSIGCHGIGLCRTEFLFIGQNLLTLSVEAQREIYEKIAQKAPSGTLVMRLFDLGSDKPFSWLDLKEQNPALGLRSTRYLLKEEKILMNQLEALLLASLIRPIDILIPLVTDLEEIEQVRKVCHLVLEKLHKEGLSIQMPLIGTMIEAPSAAVIIDKIALLSDFVSIGTNDLIQYTMVADRLSPLMARYYHSIHPAIVRLLDQVIQVCHYQSKPLCLCGEMGSNPLFIPLLAGLGLEMLSCGVRHQKKIHDLLCHLDKVECRELADRVLEMDFASDIQRTLTDFMVAARAKRDKEEERPAIATPP